MNGAGAPVAIDAAVVEHQERLLELIASGTEPVAILEQLVISLESLMAGARCSILLVSEDGRTLRHGAAPNLPSAYCRAIDGIEIGERAGSCGTAAHLRRLVIVEDTYADERWEAFRELAVEHGLRACWSSPIIAPSGNALGTFAVYHGERYGPTPRDIALLQRFSGLAAVTLRHASMLRERYRAEEERRAAQAGRAAAEQQSLARGQLLASMSHELRTPLSSIVGFCELLRTVDLPAGRRESAVAHLTEAARHLLELVEDLLDLARLEAGAAELRPAATEIAPVIADAVSILEPLALDRHVEVRTALGDGVVARADRRRLRQAVLNLISNAIKFNRTGGRVEIVTASVGDHVLIDVQDTGPGVPDLGDELLYRPFERLGCEQTGPPGTGLGLTISKQFIEAMGGRLCVAVRHEGGTRATVELPAAINPRPPSRSRRRAAAP